MKILLTGFTPFGAVETNPSQLIVEHFTSRVTHDGSVTIIAEVLPTVFETAGSRIRALIREHHPDAVVSLGVAQSRNAIHLERVALNLNDAGIPDNAGDLAQGRLIVPDGPLAYWSTLPIESMLAALKSRDIPATISNHAGAYVCNHVFFSARHEIEQLGRSIPCGFIHVPAIGTEPPGLPLATMIAAVDQCLTVLALQISVMNG
jgi:pyroglutamyl-peptidase